MKIALFATALTMWLLTTNVYSQETEEPNKISVNSLEKQKGRIVEYEKEKLKKEIDEINEKILNGEISENDANNLKQELAEKHALNIENRSAIIDNKIELIERNGDNEEKNTSYFSINFGDEDADNIRNFGVSIKRKKSDIVYDRRTTTGGFLAFGLNNVITSVESLEDSDYKVGGSRFFEIGWDWNTRVFDNTNWLRIKYGLAFQFNGLKPTDNRYLVDTGEQTELQTFPLDLKKSKFRMDNFVIPVHFEFGPSTKVENKDYFRYATHSHFKVGLGGYAGINMSTRQKLKFKDDGERKNQKLKANYNTNNFVYGLSGYIGWGAGSLYAKYDLNPIFKNNVKEQRNISLGLRLDLE